MYESVEKEKKMNIYKNKKNGMLYTVGMQLAGYCGEGPITADPYNWQGERLKVSSRDTLKRDYIMVGVR